MGKQMSRITIVWVVNQWVNECPHPAKITVNESMGEQMSGIHLTYGNP